MSRVYKNLSAIKTVLCIKKKTIKKKISALAMNDIAATFDGN